MPTLSKMKILITSGISSKTSIHRRTHVINNSKHCIEARSNKYHQRNASNYNKLWLASPTPITLSPKNKRITHIEATAAAGTITADDDNSNPRSNTFLSVVLPTALALLLCNMDRICMSVAIVPLAAEMGWSEGTQGILQSAFLWGYLANQLVGGTLADKYGGKIVLAYGIAFFSLSSALLPAFAISPLTISLGIAFPAALLARFLVGIGEGVALPSMNNLMATHVPAAHRATAIGTAFTGFHTGNLVGLVLSPLLVQRYGWRSVFYIFSLVGGPLLAFWLAVVPNKANNDEVKSNDSSITSKISSAPGSSGSSKATSKTSSDVSIKQLLSSKAVWAIITAKIINHWGYFIYLNWMPSYFYKVMGLNLRASSFFSFVPWLAMAIGASLAGVLSDKLVAGGMDKTFVRKAVQTAAFLPPVVALLILANPNISPMVALTCMTLALGFTSLGQFVANISDIAPKHAGRVFGLCNTFGSFAGILGVAGAGYIVELTGSFALVFQITALLNVVGTVIWNVCCTAEKQFD